MCGRGLLPCRSPVRPIRWGRTVSSIGNSSLSLTGPIRRNCANWSPSRYRSRSPWSNSNSSACRISTGFGDYTESGQVIPVTFKGRKGGYSHCMFLDDHPPIAGGRELWGFPKKLAKPTLHDEIDTLVGTLDYGPVRIATGTIGYKHKAADHDAVMASLLAPNFLLKIVPHVDGTPRICELVEYELTDVNLKGAWTGPAALTLSSHALAPLAELPVLEVVSGMHIIADLTLPLGKVVHDYLA